MTLSEPIPARILLVIAISVIVLQAFVSWAMGQPLICTCGTIRLWIGDVSSAENSQQLTDWYTFTHVLHGFAFYGLLWLIAPRMPFGLRLTLAIGIEVGWEIVENSPIIIERYRQSAIARGYFGDSVINSVFDTLAAIAGFMLARILPVWTIVAVAAAVELSLALAIRDGLTLNLIQLIAPNEAISRWQMGQ
jgi:hypothetical protein